MAARDRFFLSAEDDLDTFFTDDRPLDSESDSEDDEEQYQESSAMLDTREPAELIRFSNEIVQPQNKHIDTDSNSSVTQTATNLPVNADFFGCSCNERCYTKFEISDLLLHQLNCAELSKHELDLVISAKIQCTMTASKLTSVNKKKATERKQVHTYYYHLGHSICLSMFKTLHNIGKDRLTNIRKHLITHGLVPRERKKREGQHPRTHSFDTYKDMVSFLKNLGEECGVKLLGRIPGQLSLYLLPGLTVPLHVTLTHWLVCTNGH